jgi:hypothetical protein
MHHLETLIQAIPPGVFAAGGAVPGVAAPHSSTDPSTNPLAAFASASHTYPTGVPPPSLHVFPLMNPSTHFTQDAKLGERAQSPNAAFRSLLGHHYSSGHSPMTADQLAEDTARMSLSASYMYFDDEGYTRWQGETSGLPLLDLLVERHSVPSARREIMARARRESMDHKPPNGAPPNSANKDWFPNRTPRRTDINPETLWRLITSYIVPDLMDRFVATAPSFRFLSNLTALHKPCAMLLIYVLLCDAIPTRSFFLSSKSSALRALGIYSDNFIAGLWQSSEMG